jgi:hypothetical protein
MTINDKLKILNKHKNDLDKISFNELYSFIGELGLKNLCCINLSNEIEIFRAVPSEEQDFENIKRISYNPNPTKYSRANRIGFPMFYGAFPSEKKCDPVKLFGANCFEVIEILRNHPKELKQGKVNLTLGIWKVKAKIPAISLVFNDNLVKNSIDFLELQNSYRNSFNKYPDDIRIMEFFSEEFSKAEIQKNSDYKLSAAFSEFVIKNNPLDIEAIIYPSVRCGGEGFNIAMTPRYVKLFLKPDKVLTFDVYIENFKVAMDLIKESDIDELTGEINLIKSKDPNSNIGEIRIRKMLDLI